MVFLNLSSIQIMLRSNVETVGKQHGTDDTELPWVLCHHWIYHAHTVHVSVHSELD